MGNGCIRRVEGEGNIIQKIKTRKTNWFGQILLWNCLLKHVIEGKVRGRIQVVERRGRIRKKPREYLKERI
jgi:hypothetical protein